MTPPVQGLVIEWRRRGYRCQPLSCGLMSRFPAVGWCQEWVVVERLRPVRADPNKVLRYAGFAELLRPPADPADPVIGAASVPIAFHRSKLAGCGTVS